MKRIKAINIRYSILILITCLLLIAIVLRLVDLQLINGKSYRERSQRRVISTYESPAYIGKS